MTIDLELNQKLFNPTYLPYLYDYSHRREIWYGGAASGKSYFIAQKLIIKGLSSTSRKRILVIRKTMASQRESCWRLILDILDAWHIKPFCKISLSTFTIILPNKSEILFYGLEDAERIKSIVGITDIWCEEATELTSEDFDQLDLRIRAKQNDLQMFVSFNPISKANWVYKRWFENATEDFVKKTTYKDNKFLTEDYIKSLEEKIKTNPTYYKIYALGEFCSLDRLVFTNYEISDFKYTDIKGELIVGLDFGFVQDPTALVASIVDEPNKTIYCFRNWVETGRTNDKIAEAIKSLGFSKSTIIADSAEPKSIEELKKAGIYRITPSVKGPDSVIHGIQKLQQYKIVVHPECTELITELENYCWKKDKKTNEYINEPIDMFNHCIDALRYSIQALKKNRLQTMDKSILGL